MKVLNWNTQADRLSVRAPRFERSRQLVARHDADVICLTEAFPESMPEGGETVTSGLSEWKRHEDRGARKVVLWSRFGWTDVDRTGSESLPEGRFVRATTTFTGTDLTVVGMCIPYRDYRTRERSSGESGRKGAGKGLASIWTHCATIFWHNRGFASERFCWETSTWRYRRGGILQGKAWSIGNGRPRFPDGPYQRRASGTTLRWTGLSRTMSPFRRTFVQDHRSFSVVSTVTEPN